MVNLGGIGHFHGPIGPSCLFFKEMGCLIGDNDVDDSEAGSEMLDEEKMRSLILDCVVALSRVQREKKENRKQKTSDADEQHENAKNRVFTTAISMVMDNDESLDTDPALTSLLVSFPDRKKTTDGRSWLSLHFALALGDKVKEDDVRILYSYDPMAMQLLHLKETGDNDQPGFSPGHLFCMQKEPNMSLMRYLSMRDSKAFTMSVSCHEFYNGCMNSLQLAAQYCESVELIRDLMQIDQSMAKTVGELDLMRSVTALGFLCGRSHFPSFNVIYKCLIAADSSIEVVSDAVVSLFRLYGKSIFADDKVQVVLTQVRSLLKLNSGFKNGNDDTTIVFGACRHLEGNLGVAILSLLLTEYSDGVGAGLRSRNGHGSLLLHHAVYYSTVDVVQLLLKAYPESQYETDSGNNNFLHCALCDPRQDRGPVNSKVQYLCGHCPDLLKMSQNEGLTPLMYHLLIAELELDINTIMIMCEADLTIVTEKCQYPRLNQKLPLHLILGKDMFTFTSCVTVEADCFRYLLRLYPAAAGIKDGWDKSPYDKALARDMDVYFIRLLLNADPTIDPQRRRELNFTARKEAMFLAFRAVSSGQEPSIWNKLRSLYERRQLPVLLMQVISYL
jgi:hypothetical protein